MKGLQYIAIQSYIPWNNKTLKSYFFPTDCSSSVAVARGGVALHTVGMALRHFYASSPAEENFTVN